MITNDALLASVKLLASDLDGTLLNPDHVPAPQMQNECWIFLVMIMIYDRILQDDIFLWDFC